jgi:hypothetical protein
LIVWAGGVIWYVTLDGHVRHLAGDGEFTTGADVADAFPDYSYDIDKDCLATNAADEPLLVGRLQQTTADTNAFLDYHSGKLYWVGSFTDNSFGTFVEELDCQASP